MCSDPWQTPYLARNVANVTISKPVPGNCPRMLSVLFARPSASAASYGRTEDGASPCASNPKEMRRPAASQPKEMRRPAASLTGCVVRIADGDTLTILSPATGTTGVSPVVAARLGQHIPQPKAVRKAEQGWRPARCGHHTAPSLSTSDSSNIQVKVALSGFITCAARRAFALPEIASTALRLLLCMAFIISFHSALRPMA